MTRIHWVARQNKLETPEEKDEVNKREVHECDRRARDPDTMVAPPTPKPHVNPTRKNCVVVYYNGESENLREEMRWCRCYEGQRTEA